MSMHFYQTDSFETLPPNGLEKVTRAYAKIIDDVNALGIEDVAAGSMRGNR
jgi:hypothetical protein